MSLERLSRRKFLELSGIGLATLTLTQFGIGAAKKGLSLITDNIHTWTLNRLGLTDEQAADYLRRVKIHQEETEKFADNILNPEFKVKLSGARVEVLRMVDNIYRQPKLPDFDERSGHYSIRSNAEFEFTGDQVSPGFKVPVAFNLYYNSDMEVFSRSIMIDLVSPGLQAASRDELVMLARSVFRLPPAVKFTSPPDMYGVPLADTVAASYKDPETGRNETVLEGMVNKRLSLSVYNP